jgi:acid phosphatase type 7
MKTIFTRNFLCLLGAMLIFQTNFSQTNLLSFGSSWRYLDNNTRPAGWETTSFNDAAWASGNGVLGYGDAPSTVVSFGADANNKYITTYFRKNIIIINLANYQTFTVNLKRDDGAVVYVNGVEVNRVNLPAGTITHTTLAPSAITGASETTPVSFTICASYFVEGNNVIAVEMHQNTANSSDLSFDLELIGDALPTGTPTLTRNPYLQMGSQNSIEIRWRTDIPCIGKVDLGTTFGTYTITNSESCVTTEHRVVLNGLTPDTKYFYQIGTPSTVFQGATSNFFTTLPPDNTTRKLRFAVFGDCGRNDNSFQTQSINQYQNYLTSNGIDAADAMLLLGDNAYNSGTETEYTNSFFTPLGNSILKTHKLYPSPGNHDYYVSTQTDRNTPYYQNFTMPKNGELGGVASGTESFYSFNVGDVHFLSLDSYGEEAGATRLYDTLGAQVTWIKNDLAANTKKWTIAYWHHPPYTMGSHNSDTEADLAAMRENFIRILERNGVDMILCGHSHDYERSFLLKEYYKQLPADPQVNEVNFNVATHAVNNSSGKYNATANSCAYTTNSGKYNHGTVYVVSGSAGADGAVQTGYPHNAFPFSQDDGGMFYFEVDNNRLDAKFIRRDGVIADNFTIMKDVNKTNNVNIQINNPVTLTASWIGTYSWSSGQNTRSITITPTVVSSTVYTVTDGLGCIADQFTVNALSALPVIINNYSIKNNYGKVDHQWTTTSETNNKFFTIEYSTNGTDFVSLTNINSIGNSSIETNYNYTHNNPVHGVNYYRLSQTNVDNKTTYLGVRKIDLKNKKSVSIASIKNGANTLLQFSSNILGVYKMKIIDNNGRIALNENITIDAPIIKKQVNLPSGVYFCELTNAANEITIEKLLIN